MEELAALREMLAGAEEDLIRYRAHKDSGNPYLAANFAHKAEQVEAIKQKIAELEKEESQ